MSPFDAHNTPHDEPDEQPAAPVAWPPGMDAVEPAPAPAAPEAPEAPEAPGRTEDRGQTTEPEHEPALHIVEPAPYPELVAEPEPEPLPEVEPEPEPLPEPVALAEPEVEDDVEPEVEPVVHHDEHEFVLPTTESTMTSAAAPADRSRMPRLRGPSISLPTGASRTRTLALVALLVVVGAVGLVVMRSGSSDDPTAPAAKSVVADTKAAAPGGAAAGTTRVTVSAGGYRIDVPTSLSRTVNGALLTASSADRSRAYAVNGATSTSESVAEIAKRLMAGYRKTYRLTAVTRSTAAGGELRITARGVRRGASQRQDIVAVVFRGDGGKGTYVLQRFSPHGKAVPAGELNGLRDSLQPSA